MNVLRRGLFLLISLFLISGCDSESEKPETEKVANSLYGGGLFRMSLTENLRSIFPHNLVDASAFNLMNQVYEGLFQLDYETKEVIPSLAESYEVSADGLTYTIKLRKGVYFHDDEMFPEGKGREVKAQDVIYCFSRLSEPSPDNSLYPFVIDIIKGAREYYTAKSAGSTKALAPEGLKVIDDYTLEIELYHPTPNFLAILTHPCCWIFPKELYEYGEDMNRWCIGTGPFKARIIKMNEVIILEKNQNYWQKDEQGNNLPYLNAVRCNFFEDENEQLSSFLEGHLDLIFSVPLEKLDAIPQIERQGFRALTFSGLRVEYYGFQNRSELFDDVRLRRAINMAIDRRFLVDSVLKGFAEVADHGFVPPAMPGYNAKRVRGYGYNPEMARSLLREAGFENPDDFPVLTIQINDGNPKALIVAEEVQEMLTENLGITIELSILPRDKHYDEIEHGKVKVWRDGWIADYPDPENFLKLFHGKLVPDDTVKASYLNTVRFKNEKFDSYFEKSMRETNAKLRLEYLVQADQVIMEEAAVAPLYYEKWIWLLNDRVKKLNISPTGVLDLKEVYISEAEDLPV